MLRYNLASKDILSATGGKLNTQKASLALLLLASLILGPLYSTLGISVDLQYSSILGLLALTLFIKVQFQKKPKETLTSYFYIYYFFSMLISAAVIENGALMFEIGEQGSYNGTFWTILFYFLLGFTSISFGFSLHSKISNGPILKARYSIKLERLVVAIFLIATSLVSALILIKYSSPILLGVERFTFWNTIVPPGLQIAKSLITQAFYFVPALIIVANSKQRKTMTLLATFTWIGITLFVLGEKFTAFQYYLAIAAFYFAALGTHSKKLKIPYKTLAIIFTVLISILAYVYSATGYSIEFIYSRIALQSQLTWITIEKNMNVSSIWTGASELTMAVLPGDRFDRYADAGVSLTGFFPAVQIAALGYTLSSILHILIFIIAGFIQAEILKLISNKCITQSFFLFKLYISLIFFWLALDAAQLYNGVNLICLGLLLAGFIMQKFAKNRTTSHI
ncbi:DUF6418 domain-containing protein [Pseudomonas sp. BF-B-27]|uniref:DUF6418 domain-containing protein n=1 Tax=Pseudomonas sp. BF-B-27 TaxID=2832354 RepID=UPI001CBBADBF|nr:DUF6418 domain-containing protein [Pseudomonas sp. BF-B-27]